MDLELCHVEFVLLINSSSIELSFQELRMSLNISNT